MTSRLAHLILLALPRLPCSRGGCSSASAQQRLRFPCVAPAKRPCTWRLRALALGVVLPESGGSRFCLLRMLGMVGGACWVWRSGMHRSCLRRPVRKPFLLGPYWSSLALCGGSCSHRSSFSATRRSSLTPSLCARRFGLALGGNVGAGVAQLGGAPLARVLGRVPGGIRDANAVRLFLGCLFASCLTGAGC